MSKAKAAATTSTRELYILTTLQDVCVFCLHFCLGMQGYASAKYHRNHSMCGPFVCWLEGALMPEVLACVLGVLHQLDLGCRTTCANSQLLIHGHMVTYTSAAVQLTFECLQRRGRDVQLLRGNAFDAGYGAPASWPCMKHDLCQLHKFHDIRSTSCAAWWSHDAASTFDAAELTACSCPCRSRSPCRTHVGRATACHSLSPGSHRSCISNSTGQ